MRHGEVDVHTDQGHEQLPSRDRQSQDKFNIGFQMFIWNIMIGDDCDALYAEAEATQSLV